MSGVRIPHRAQMEHFFVQNVALFTASVYFLLAVGTFFEGSAVMMGGGYLLHLGVVAFLPLYATLLVADIAADILWYAIGYHGARSFVTRWGSYIKVTPEILNVLTEKFHKHDTRILVISKLSMGFGFAVGVLLTAGMVRVPFLKFLTINVLGSLVWVLFLIGLGYLLGNVLGTIPLVLQIALVVAGIFAFLAFYRYLVSQIPTSKL